MVPFRVNCTIPTLSKSKAVRGKYCIVLPGEETFEKSSRPIRSLLHSRFYCRHATLLLSTDAAKKLKYSLCRFAEILHEKQSHQSGWTRVIGKILALNQRHFDTEKSYVPSGIIFYWLFKYGTRTSSCICYSYWILTKLIRTIKALTRNG